MYNSLSQFLKRFYCPKLILQIQEDLKSYQANLLFARNNAQIVMLDEEKNDFEITQTEVNNLSWLHKVAPGFPVNGENITVIYEPAIFYNLLLEKCKHAKNRITFASLYLGTGKLETELVQIIQQTINSNKGNIEIKILLDYMRGSRGEANSCKMLKSLLKGNYGHCCQIFLYHTPNFRGFLKAIIPDRFNELIGLQHMKLYIIDDALIISGANLSNDYFTNRQDRYFLIEKCKELCDFYNKLVTHIGNFSFLLRSDGRTVWCSTLKSHPFKSPRNEFTKEAGERIQILLQKEIDKRRELHKKKQAQEADTWIFPLIQMGQLNVKHDSEVTLRLLQTPPPGVKIKLATGYFNLTSEYSQAIIKHSKATCELLTAHPTTNGFFDAKGLASGIPAAYTMMEKSFYKICEQMRQENRITLWEFVKPGWTYHAKGLWYFLPGQQYPCLTLIGSPNFGYRSVKRDLETQIAIVTKSEQLQNALYNEQERLFSFAIPVTKDTFSQEKRIAPVWVSAVVFLFRYYF